MLAKTAAPMKITMTKSIKMKSFPNENPRSYTAPSIKKIAVKLQVKNMMDRPESQYRHMKKKVYI